MPRSRHGRDARRRRRRSHRCRPAMRAAWRSRDRSSPPRHGSGDSPAAAPRHPSACRRLPRPARRRSPRRRRPAGPAPWPAARPAASARTPARTLPLGRPKCAITITLAPLPASSFRVAAERSMRVESVTLPSFIGTLRSRRTITFFPVTARSSRVRNSLIRLCPSLGCEPQVPQGPEDCNRGTGKAWRDSPSAAKIRFMAFKSALITGASSGIGAAFARGLPRTTELLLAGRDRDALAALAQELTSPGRMVRTVIADFTETAGRDRRCRRGGKRRGRSRHQQCRHRQARQGHRQRGRAGIGDRAGECAGAGRALPRVAAQHAAPRRECRNARRAHQRLQRGGVCSRCRSSPPMRRAKPFS